MDSKKVCLSLLAAESELEVEKILTSIPEMQDSKNWRPLDGRETNFNVTSNQASDGGKALTELMTNMVDAVLLKHAYLKGVDPKGKKAPATMYQAVDQLVHKMHGGKLVNLGPNDPWLKQFAQNNLAIGITGAKSKAEGLPCYSFADNGEGQHPDEFETTFLSLSAGNKKSINFVQGKFNMGSSGVLRYCGRRWFKLIVSRRFDKSGPWGWTIMRRRPTDADRMPVAEYFVMPGDKIARFDAEELYPYHTIEKKRYDRMHLNAGTIVKLYDYQVGSRFLSFRGSRDALNENLVETILPFRILDLRQKPDPKRGPDRALGVDPRPFYGMEFLLLNSHKEEGLEGEDEASGEDRVFVGKFSYPNLGEVSISAIPLKRDIPGWLKPNNSNNRVFHAVNGQVQYKQTRGYLSNTCGFPALKDRVVLIVDASNLTFAAHNEVWKGDREHISNTLDGERYLEEVTKTIKESQALKDLQAKIASEELERAAKTEGNSLFQKLVDRDPSLAGLLSSRDPSIKLPASGGSKTGGKESGTAEEFEGSYSPSFIRLEERIAKNAVEIPLGRSRPLGARTDAANDYLQRPDNPGRVILDPEIRKKFGVREHLKDGRLTLYLSPGKEDVDIDDTFTFQIALHDEAMPEAVGSEEVRVLIVAAIDEDDENKVKPKPKPKPDVSGGDKKAGDGEDAPTHGLPAVILLTKDGRDVPGYQTEEWPEDFSETDGGLIQDLGKESVYKINYDNVYHIKYRKAAKDGVARDVITEKYILGMRILLLGCEHALRSMHPADGSGNSGIGEFMDDFRRMAARGAASTVLALAENLPKIVDASSVQQAEQVE
ncbi:hypothetical protein FJ934_08570 [Mesorhizobium sp. B2-4-12]|uniref:hypothetical protein n=1 Tax=Mesorhizobium sp. B2-4-12 TaxID=2589937 RepID=UPI0011264F2A|nr:hypothetical protein [Mesorhizobium sp. B2-4-12]TPK96605.1 hypothetical protein FJ934_08570 [Mesorhizobium sp. B2-4-12]